MHQGYIICFYKIKQVNIYLSNNSLTAGRT